MVGSFTKAFPPFLSFCMTGRVSDASGRDRQQRVLVPCVSRQGHGAHAGRATGDSSIYFRTIVPSIFILN